MIGKSSTRILLCLLFGSLISNSNQYNLDNFLSRRNFLKTISSLRLINLNLNNNYLEDDENNYQDLNLLSNNLHSNKKSHFLNNNIYFTGGLNEETCFKLTEILNAHKNMALTNQDYPNHINLYIQSPGGSLLPTLAVVDEIINLGVPVHTYIRGYAASAATLISVVGKERYIYKNSLMMIHGVKLSDQTVSNVLDIKDLNYNVDLFMSIIKNIYLENSNIDNKTLELMFDHNIWIDSNFALKMGLVDKIL